MASSFGLNQLLLVIAALAPAAALCIYVFKKDRVEKEPIGLLLFLLLAGVVITTPAATLEGFIIGILDAVFAPFMSVLADGTAVFTSVIPHRIYNFFKAFIGVALVEEGLKWGALILVTRKNREFNSVFDGLIYAIFVSLGFAAFENVLYVIQNGWMVAIMRAVLAVPGHMFDAVIMGYFYSMWHLTDKAAEIESSLHAEGILRFSGKTFSSKNYIIMSLLMPVLAHGLYDYCCFVGSGLSTLALYVFVIILYFVCFGRIRKMSLTDARDHDFALAMILNKYPFLAEEFKTRFCRQESSGGIY